MLVKTNSDDTRSRNLYQKLASMHVTKIMRFDCSAVFESFWTFWYKVLERFTPITLKKLAG